MGKWNRWTLPWALLIGAAVFGLGRAGDGGDDDVDNGAAKASGAAQDSGLRIAVVNVDFVLERSDLLREGQERLKAWVARLEPKFSERKRQIDKLAAAVENETDAPRREELQERLTRQQVDHTAVRMNAQRDFRRRELRLRTGVLHMLREELDAWRRERGVDVILPAGYNPFSGPAWCGTGGDHDHQHPPTSVLSFRPELDATAEITERLNRRSGAKLLEAIGGE